MPPRCEFHFRIQAYTPETLPMARLAEYMADLATILGHQEAVHFTRLDPGSTNLVHWVEDEAVPKVRDRLKSVCKREGPFDAMRAYRALNRRLAEDNGSAALTEDHGAEIIEFPGVNESHAVTFGAFNQDGSLEGELIRLGGRGDPAPVHLERESGSVLICHARRELVSAMGHHMYKPLRVNGYGRWHRDENGEWLLDRFTIGSFDPLDDAPLSTVVRKLRRVPGGGWTDLDEPLEELKRIREGPEEVQ